MAKIASIHDKFVQKVLSDMSTAADYFRTALPANVLEKLDFSTLSQQPTTYVNKELRRSIADLVYSCQRKDGRGSVEISLLLEHKSKPDRFTPVQIGGYLYSGYQQQIEDGRKQLSPIIPILFYHGKEQWAYRTLDGLFDDLDEDLIGYIPKYDYIYHDLEQLPEERIPGLRNNLLASFFLSLKSAWDKDRLKTMLPKILSLGLGQENEQLQAALLMYNLSLVGLTEEQIQELLDDLSPDPKDIARTAYGVLVEKGRRETWAEAEKLIEQERAKAEQLIEQERARAEQERAKAKQAETKAKQEAYTEKLTSAAELKKMGVPVQDIAKVLQLPLEVVEKL